MAVNQFGAGVRFFVDGASQAIRDTNSIAKGFGTIQDSAGNASLAVQDTTNQTMALQFQFQERLHRQQSRWKHSAYRNL